MAAGLPKGRLGWGGPGASKNLLHAGHASVKIKPSCDTMAELGMIKMRYTTNARPDMLTAIRSAFISSESVYQAMTRSDVLMLCKSERRMLGHDLQQADFLSSNNYAAEVLSVGRPPKNRCDVDSPCPLGAIA